MRPLIMATPAVGPTGDERLQAWPAAAISATPKISPILVVIDPRCQRRSG